MNKYIAVDLIVSDNKKFLTEDLLLTDEIFDAKYFTSIQDCEYFINAKGLSKRLKPLQVSYYYEMSNLKKI